MKVLVGGVPHKLKTSSMEHMHIPLLAVAKGVLKLEKEDGVIRVEVNDDGTFDVLDFSITPVMCRDNTPQDEVPAWIMEAVCMLRITDPQTVIPELGFKLSDTVYYLVERRDHE